MTLDPQTRELLEQRIGERLEKDRQFWRRALSPEGAARIACEVLEDALERLECVICGDAHGPLYRIKGPAR